MKRLMFSAVAAMFIFAFDHAKAESIATLYNTGISDAVTPLPDSAVDPHYILTQVPAGSGFGPNTYVVDSTLYPLATEEWMANSATSKWISAQADQTTFPNDVGSGNYAFRTTFDLTGLDAASAEISGQWTMDDFGLDILINGVSTGNTHTDYSQAPIFQTFKSFSISAGFVAGLNALDFLVRNEPFGGDINPMGLRVELNGTASPVPALVGDYDGDLTVGPEDYNVWKSSYGSSTILAADGNGNHIVDAADYTVWRDNLGGTLGFGSGAALPSAASLSPAVPEPSALALAAVGIVGLIARISRRRHLNFTDFWGSYVRGPL